MYAPKVDGAGFAAKHAADRIVAGAALLVLSPLLIVLALAVRLTSRGPVLFCQTRVGLGGREFGMLKFRSMRPRCTEDALAEIASGCAPGGVEGTDRRTLVGRFLRRSSLDELPQLWNVVRGEMSLVGPRPERPDWVARFTDDVRRYDDRHRVHAGLTGWAQVNGLRGQTSISDRVEHDNFYIENWSPWLDVKVLAGTASAALRGE
ncbi:MAG: sugar transferase [Thermoleophilaceae bacterium]|nr:sugar transferase [Thermoleophilaceae bacterium]